ncbi:GNAT family N-acetyltransferase [Aestuariimicrobium sp. T2.26MG-19.2B]|uniref:GNAT family N-acetyltransferase n=1 Tax=Aestuariimicrobium sp. T2.26MG-19.2B TaxID=3040679 RepID=UPI0024778A40|nr:GNAT family N-acetyltransferase [Aestuariimicrobium sp. T2.26MG-19.2B]CAI9403228.1 hypothetical protein AESSP_00962 [Aestuariimicrobium sp. T2.26MG-19.2B]
MSGNEKPIRFGRLTEVPLEEVSALLNEPRNARHMPLAHRLSEGEVAAWVRGKDAQWSSEPYGPWAIWVGDRFAGWGGFQREDEDADFALVLLPAFWGWGSVITTAALDRGFDELGLDSVTIALPDSRNPDQAVARFGFVPDGEVSYDGTSFRRFRLSRSVWRAATGSS